MEEILQKYGLEYDQLTIEERETLHSWMNALKEGNLSLEKVRDYVARMRESVEQELTRFDTDGKLDLYLRARLRNLMLLDAFLTSPEKAKAQLERVLQDIAGGVG